MRQVFKAGLRHKLQAHVGRGGLIAYATASCFGVGCDPRNAKAVRRLLVLKRRPKNKGLILVAHDFQLLAPFVAPLSVGSRERALKRWPGPHTWLMSASRQTSRSVRGNHDEVAVRVDGHPDTIEICRILGMAITSSSLNRTGQVPVRTYREASRQFGGCVLVLPGRIGGDKRPSTIEDFTTGRIIRP
ncbi:MAG: Sua5/YciO/YrdC/YwlC family protein [Burkholderiales bacterium]|nr:Sua5/YciO/YrdC/YwlC family protein [Burkholderiales bacterium]